MKDIKETAHTIRLTTGSTHSCEHCDEDWDVHENGVADPINHYIERHGYSLLHVGSEFGRDQRGVTVHHTVAILGR